METWEERCKASEKGHEMVEGRHQRDESTLSSRDQFETRISLLQTITEQNKRIFPPGPPQLLCNKIEVQMTSGHRALVQPMRGEAA